MYVFMRVTSYRDYTDTRIMKTYRQAIGIKRRGQKWVGVGANGGRMPACLYVNCSKTVYTYRTNAFTLSFFLPFSTSGSCAVFPVI